MDFEKRIKDITENQTKLLESFDNALKHQTELIENIRNLITDLDVSLLEDSFYQHRSSNLHRALRSQEKVFDMALGMIKEASKPQFANEVPSMKNLGEEIARRDALLNSLERNEK